MTFLHCAIDVVTFHKNKFDKIGKPTPNSTQDERSWIYKAKYQKKILDASISSNKLESSSLLNRDHKLNEQQVGILKKGCVFKSTKRTSFQNINWSITFLNLKK